jgi:hypothetical protein
MGGPPCSSQALLLARLETELLSIVFQDYSIQQTINTNELPAYYILLSLRSVYLDGSKRCVVIGPRQETLC